MLILSIAPHMVKSVPTMQDIQVQSLGQKNPLEKGMATHSSGASLWLSGKESAC